MHECNQKCHQKQTHVKIAKKTIAFYLLILLSSFLDENIYEWTRSKQTEKAMNGLVFFSSSPFLSFAVLPSSLITRPRLFCGWEHRKRRDELVEEDEGWEADFMERVDVNRQLNNLFKLSEKSTWNSFWVGCCGKNWTFLFLCKELGRWKIFIVIQK